MLPLFFDFFRPKLTTDLRPIAALTALATQTAIRANHKAGKHCANWPNSEPIPSQLEIWKVSRTKKVRKRVRHCERGKISKIAENSTACATQASHRSP